MFECLCFLVIAVVVLLLFLLVRKEKGLFLLLLLKFSIPFFVHSERTAVTLFEGSNPSSKISSTPFEIVRPPSLKHFWRPLQLQPPPPAQLRIILYPFTWKQKIYQRIKIKNWKEKIKLSHYRKIRKCWLKNWYHAILQSSLIYYTH